MERPSIRVICGDALTELRRLPSESVHCCVTSPPYWQLRDYGVAGQLGLEPTPGQYVSKLVRVFSELRRVLRSDGTLWLNLGDSYISAWARSQINRVMVKSCAGMQESECVSSVKYRTEQWPNNKRAPHDEGPGPELWMAKEAAQEVVIDDLLN